MNSCLSGITLLSRNYRLFNPLSLTVRALGGDYKCSGGRPVDSQASIYGTTTNNQRTTLANVVIKPNSSNQSESQPQVTLPNQPKNMVIDFTGDVAAQQSQGQCVPYNPPNGYNSVSNPAYVKILKQGDEIPGNAGYGGGKAIASYLSNYTYVNPQTGKKYVNFTNNANKQVIVLFELYNTSSGNTYDLQDIVLLVTITPK